MTKLGTLSKYRAAMIFLLAATLGGALVFSCAQRKPLEKTPEKQPLVEQQQKTQDLVLPLPIVERVSVDFDQAPLADVAAFIALCSGKGFVLQGVEQALSWVEYDIPKNRLFTSFQETLAVYGLEIVPVNREKTVFTFAIFMRQTRKWPRPLRVGSSARSRVSWTLFLKAMNAGFCLAIRCTAIWISPIHSIRKAVTGMPACLGMWRIP